MTKDGDRGTPRAPGKEASGIVRETVRVVLSGYAQVIFASQWQVGVILLAATFVAPAQGAAGLIGLALTSLFALALGMDRAHVRDGFYAYNGLLVGLALGMSWQPNAPFLLLLAAASLLAVLVAAGLRAIAERFLGVPVLSWPFVITTWAAVAAGRHLAGLAYAGAPGGPACALPLPETIEYFARSLGAAFFVPSAPAGLLVALALLVFSRHAFLLAAAGLAAGTWFHRAIGGDPADLTVRWVGFNFALAAIATGGMWMVPGPGAFVLATVVAALTAVVSVAAAAILGPLGMPPLALPFVLATTLTLFALKHRTRPGRLVPIWLPAGTPEQNLKATRNIRARFLTGAVPAFPLPVTGEWTITQGFEGEHTHKGLWAHAWDLELLDESGKAYTGTGERAADFHAYGKPVFAPAEGRVVRVVNHVEDNPIGQVNTRENWGNLVILWHYGSVYTALCHLQTGSSAVKEGETVAAQQVIGKVGSSGRSPAPHLHFQVQYSPEVGAPTADAELLHYLEKTAEAIAYHTHGRPATGTRLKPMEPDRGRFEALSFPLGGSWRYRVARDGRMAEETIETEIDFAGSRYLVSREHDARVRIFVNRHVFMSLDSHGPRDGLLPWIFLALPRAALTQDDVAWRDELPGEFLLPAIPRVIYDLVEPFVPLARLRTSSRFAAAPDGAGFAIETVLSASGPLAHRALDGVVCTASFDRSRGLVALRASRGVTVILDAVQIDQEGP